MIRSVFLAASLLAVTSHAQTRDAPVAMGNLGVHFLPKSALSTEAHPLTAATTGPIWCQATFNEVPLPINASNFVRYHDPQRRRFAPSINTTTNKATLEINQTVYDNMGKYRCEITYDNGKQNTIFGNLMVYSRPFFHANASMKLTLDEQDKFLVIGEKVYASESARVLVHCPAAAFPKPTITWYKDTEVLESSPDQRVRANGTLLTIDNFAESDEGVYRCTATNSFPTRLDEQVLTYEASLEQEVRIGSPYGWLLPLAVIFVILLLLFVIIYACAACKRYQHDNYNVAKREKLLGTASPSNASSTPTSKKYELVSNA